MKLTKLKASSQDPSEKILIDLSKAQSPHPLWNSRYLINAGKTLAIPEAVFETLTGLSKNDTFRYHHTNLFEECGQVRSDLEAIFLDPSILKGKKVLMVLAHPHCLGSDFLLALPFLKVFVEAFDLKLSICTHSALVGLAKNFSWIQNVYPEIIAAETVEGHDFVLEMVSDKRELVEWLACLLLRHLGENALLNRFPSPPLKLTSKAKSNYLAEVKQKTNLNPTKKLCLLNLQVSGAKRALTPEAIKALVGGLNSIDFQVLYLSSDNLSEAGLGNWILKQPHVIDATSLVPSLEKLALLTELVDFVVAPENINVHLAGLLRKPCLCIFTRQGLELHGHSAFRGTYWPAKFRDLYPSMRECTISQEYSKDLEARLYKALRESYLAFDQEILILYQRILTHLPASEKESFLAELLAKRHLNFKSVAPVSEPVVALQS